MLRRQEHKKRREGLGYVSSELQGSTIILSYRYEEVSLYLCQERIKANDGIRGNATSGEALVLLFLLSPAVAARLLASGLEGSEQGSGKH